MKNLIKWFEIPASDFNRAVEFYKNVFEIEIKTFDLGNEKMGCFPNDEGAISLSRGFKPSLNGVLVSLDGGNDLNEVLKKAEKFGGKTITPKTKIQEEGRGYFAIFSDSEGNKLGLYSDN